MSSTATAIAELQHSDGTIDEYSIVRVRNTMTRDFRIDYANKRWDIGAGKERTLPYHCMVMVCGDPRAFDVPGDMRQRYRTDEWQRLRILYGVYDDILANGENLPKLEVYDLDGNRIQTVLDDPEGNADELAAINESELERTQNMLMATMQRLKELEASMADIVSRQQVPPDPTIIAELDEQRRTETPATTPLVEVPTDGAPTIPVGQSSGTLKPPAKNIVPSAKVKGSE